MYYYWYSTCYLHLFAFSINFAFISSELQFNIQLLVSGSRVQIFLVAIENDAINELVYFKTGNKFSSIQLGYIYNTIYGISDYNINRIQRIQNSAARIVTNTRKYDHITMFFKNYIGYLLDSVSISIVFNNL